MRYRENLKGRGGGFVEVWGCGGGGGRLGMVSKLMKTVHKRPLVMSRPFFLSLRKNYLPT